MSAEVVEHWLNSRRNAIVYQLSLKPIENKLMKGKPLSSIKGQAETFFLIDDNGNWWILKKFHNARSLDCKYLNRIGSLLPKHVGFSCGTDRYVLSRGVLRRTAGYHYNRDLDNWLNGTILMPRIKGFDWASIADDIRDGSRRPDEIQRFTICRNLANLIELLEANHCCHRDLSCGNVFIDTDTWEVYLIDFDSLYHPSFTMPQATTCGTVGYTSHLAWNNGQLDSQKTWCEHADRYALTLLNIEFLMLRPGAKVTGEGGLFDEDELKNQRGKGINSVVAELRSKYPGIARLLESAIRSSTFSDCPSPQEWTSFCNTVPGTVVTPPGLDEFPRISLERYANAFKKRRPAAPIWPAPSLEEMSKKELYIPKTRKIWIPTLALPWNLRKNEH